MTTWFTSYRKEWLRPDVIAGLTTAAVVIPKAMAYATIAGLPVEVGLYTAFLPMVIYAVLGTSRVLSVTDRSGISPPRLTTSNVKTGFGSSRTVVTKPTASTLRFVWPGSSVSIRKTRRVWPTLFSAATCSCA